MLPLGVQSGTVKQYFSPLLSISFPLATFSLLLKDWRLQRKGRINQLVSSRLEKYIERSFNQKENVMSSIIHSLALCFLFLGEELFRLIFEILPDTQFGNEREETSSFSPNMFFVGFWALAGYTKQYCFHREMKNILIFFLPTFPRVWLDKREGES